MSIVRKSFLQTEIKILVLPLQINMAIGQVVSERYDSLQWLLIVSSLQLLALAGGTLAMPHSTPCHTQTNDHTH